MVERLTYVRSTYVMCGDPEQSHLPKSRKDNHVKQIDIFLPMIPPTATQQEKKINFKTKTVYADPAAKDARAKLRAYLSKEIPEEPLTGPIHMTVIWGFPAKEKHQNGDWHISKPDLDNLQKALQDVMTELGYFTDDCRICQLQTSKIYTYHPGVSIMANEMEGNAYEGIHC